MTTVAERTKFPQVLLVEDNRGDAILIRKAFERADVPGRVTVADTAEMGLKILRQGGDYAQAPRPDLILVDLNLPYMSGSEFLTQVKTDPDLRVIPAIVMSSSKAETDLLDAYKAYANGFVTKPFTRDDYDRVVSSLEDYWFQFIETPDPRRSVLAKTGDPMVEPAS
ncbi:response regulator [Asticcacaulis sp. AC402]|uniref:response regulator n=1 Tax=Asticcacaulis sp. AC402 TaxID=1282361 RepID=UPI0003C3B44E|nr:response regulator [Asticcacaulis sp. AC402]ESQ75332.1 hypothetical protein ABAC402_09510 [Asticcacaulis sp. AC402]